jgi:hypothetical protein
MHQLLDNPSVSKVICFVRSSSKGEKSEEELNKKVEFRDGDFFATTDGACSPLYVASSCTSLFMEC